MDEETLKKACERFKKKYEEKASYYNTALEIVDAYPLQASIIMLATWNSGSFRFAQSDTRNLFKLQKAIKETEPLFEKKRRKTQNSQIR